MARGINKVILIDLYLSGLSIPEVAERSCCHQSTVRYHLFKAGVLRSRTDGVRNAGVRGRLGGGTRGKNRKFSEAHCKAIAEARKRYGETHAKGICKKSTGYIEHTRGENKGKLQHRVIMEQIIGRKLRHDEHVHHKDGDMSNNQPSNLELMTRSQHSSHHAAINSQTRRRRSNGTWC